MTKPPAFQFYAQDFMNGSRLMTLAERGAYITLLCHQWDKGGVPADDVSELGRILGCTASNARQIWQRIAHKFFRDAKGLFRNRRLERERSKQKKFRKSQSNKGKASAQRRNRGSTAVQPDGNQPWLNPSSSSSSSDQKISTPQPPAAAGGRILRDERKWAKAELNRWRDQRRQEFAAACGHQPEWQARRSGIDPGPAPARCWHEPVCADDGACIDRIARERRGRAAS